MSHSNLSTTHEPEHDIAFVDSMREIGYYDGSIRGCNNYPSISSFCRFLSADPLWAIIILSHLIGHRKEYSILSVEWAETGSQLNGFCQSHQSWLVIDLVMTSHNHDRSSKTRWSWPHNTELRGAAGGDGIAFLLKNERRVLEGMAAAFLTFSRCGELAVCVFQFILPVKLSPTSILHSGQWQVLELVNYEGNSINSGSKNRESDIPLSS